jgi:tetratricopeptide (TPR) repeat protein
VNHAADLIATLAPVDTAATAPITAAAVPPAPSAAGSSSSAALDATLKPYLEAADKAWKARYYAKAKAIYTELLNVVPTLGVALSRLGEIEAQAGRHDDACLLLERALRVDPASVPAAIALAKAQLASGDAAEAAGVLKAAMDRWEGKKSAAAAAKARTLKIELGRTLFAGGARQEGGQLLTEILSQDVEEQDALEVRPNPRPRRCVHHTPSPVQRPPCWDDPRLPLGRSFRVSERSTPV